MQGELARRKQKAIEKIQEIQRGSGIDRTHFPEEMKGSIAKEQWHNVEFSYGFEYGYIQALMDTFDLTKSSMGWEDDVSNQ